MATVVKQESGQSGTKLSHAYLTFSRVTGNNCNAGFSTLFSITFCSFLTDCSRYYVVAETANVAVGLVVTLELRTAVAADDD